MKRLSGDRWTLALVAAVQVAFLWPMLQTGYLGDDSINADAAASAEQTGQSYLGYSRGIASDWLTGAGRWFPLVFMQT